VRRHHAPDGRAPRSRETARAKELAAANRALRLTPDHWMIPLFGDPMASGKRFALEGRLISVALQALRLGTSVVLDFGLWGRDERWALRWLAHSAGASCRVIYLPVDKDVQLARIAHRHKTTPHQTWTRGGSNSRCLTPPNSTAVRSLARRRGGRAGRSGQQTTGPRAPTAKRKEERYRILRQVAPISRRYLSRSVESEGRSPLS
jgi:predicted kinase